MPVRAAERDVRRAGTAGDKRVVIESYDQVERTTADVRCTDIMYSSHMSAARFVLKTSRTSHNYAQWQTDATGNLSVT